MLPCLWTAVVKQGKMCFFCGSLVVVARCYKHLVWVGLLYNPEHASIFWALIPGCILHHGAEFLISTNDTMPALTLKLFSSAI
ncbi:hypothetical protein GOP47_0002955 [Adiantum capillus-veneris]|uniref:Uncharacterized protein n=1 Tax=Adiantum capillus-veneris TaxID=13818 RepID=A0A9D4ZRT1_ADICA|nr:hypothetical protein GOP47_0002955 [Adiantum capillus-veneris]